MNGVASALRTRYTALGSWRAVGAETGINPAMAWRVALHRYDPVSAAVRRTLRLAPRGTFVPVGPVEIVAAAQVGMSAQRCILCRRWFIPNHPLRRRCFICAPVRSRKEAP